VASLNTRSIKILIAFIFVLLFNLGCQGGGLKRPVGYMRLGLISELTKPETYFPEERLMLRHDERGFSVMSTVCTYDLSPLLKQKLQSSYVWVSSFTDSSYEADGKVRTGPTKADLPYYRLEFGAAAYGGPIDTIYVEVGVERDKDFRLALPVATAH